MGAAMADFFDTDLAPHILGKEGGYVNDPADSGGETIWGITAVTARRYGYAGPMRDMTRTQALAIYRARFYDGPGFAKVAELSRPIARELFDTGVNMGPAVPSLWLQENLNGLNNGGVDYPDLKEDGDLGPATLAALGKFLSKRGALGEKVLLAMLNADQAVRYKSLSRARPKDERYLFGWLSQRVLA